MATMARSTGAEDSPCGIRAAGVADVLVAVGELGRTVAEEALASGLAAEWVHVAEDFETAVEILRSLMRPQDLVLVKGSRAVGMDRIVAEITLDQAALVAAKAEG